MAKSTRSQKPSRMQVELQEAVSGGKPTVDRENCVIRGVKILGNHSRNHGEYTREALQQAAELYEGQRVNIDHPDRKTPGVERSLRDSFGWLESVKIAGDDGVYGDLHYLKSHPLAEQVCEMAERCPDKFGLSHNAVGHQSRRGGKAVVESIERVRSVDLVQKPATNRGLFESEEETVKKTVRQILESVYSSKRKKLATLLEMEGVDPEAPVEVPADAAADGGSTEDQVKAAFRAMVIAAFDDESLDTKATLAKIKDILAAQEKLMSSGDAAEPPADEGGDGSESEEVAESVDELKTKLRQMEAREKARTLLESKGIAPLPSRVAAVARCSSTAEQKELLESWPQDAAAAAGRPGKVAKPKFSHPLLESDGGGSVTSIPKDAKGFVSAIR